MHFHVVTLFPEMIRQSLEIGIVGQAIKDGRVSLTTINPREFTNNIHHSVDDRPFGGGDGMIMLAQTLQDSVDALRARGAGKNSKVIHLSPRGVPLNDKLIRKLARELSASQEATGQESSGKESSGQEVTRQRDSNGHIILIASRYGGVDQRFLSKTVDLEISVGDYILSGGEIPALVLMDALSRHSKGVLGNEASIELESFADGLLEHPQYTRPREWQGHAVPQALLSGHHEKIGQWQRALSFLVTLERRPDLLENLNLDEMTILGKPLSRKFVEATKAVFNAMSPEDRKISGLSQSESLSLRLEEIIVSLPENPRQRNR